MQAAKGKNADSIDYFSRPHFRPMFPGKTSTSVLRSAPAPAFDQVNGRQLAGELAGRGLES